MSGLRLARREALQSALGEAIRRRRRELRLSAEQLAQRVGTHRPLVSRAEAGVHELSLGTIVRYADALELTPSTLLWQAEQLAEDRAARVAADVAGDPSLRSA